MTAKSMRGVAIGSVLYGLHAIRVRVEATARTCAVSEARLTIQGLSEEAAREARISVRSAVGFDHHQVEVVLEGVPARVDTSPLDLAIAVAVLRAIRAVGVDRREDVVFVGQLALGGRVNPVRGALCHVDGSDGASVVVPFGNAWEAGLATSSGEVQTVTSLVDLCGKGDLPHVDVSSLKPHTLHGAEDLPLSHRSILDGVYASPRGALLVGRPGSGKTMVARRVATMMHALSHEEGCDVARIYGAAGLNGGGGMTATRPFRAPHHTVSNATLVGGGSRGRPGEVSLAHHGVLFLDEVLEFRSSTLEELARVLEVGQAELESPGMRVVSFPAKPCVVLAATNPCPCAERMCRCRPDVLARYKERLERCLSLFRFRRIEVPDVSLASLTATGSEVSP